MTHPDLIVGLETGDDAAVWRRPDGRALIATVDFFAPVVDDAFAWGAIGAANSASDVYAMGGQPLFALNVVAWPKDSLPLELLSDVLAGATATARRGGWIIAGGHSVDGPEPLFGQVVIGELPVGAEPLKNAGARPGDVLVVTKALGTGLVTTAHKRLSAQDTAPDGAWGDTFKAALASMSELNDVAAAAARRAGVRCATDVTGFGLAGHLHKMLAASDASATLRSEALPLLPGVGTLIANGFVPGGTQRNLEFIGDALQTRNETLRILLADPQTSGGLLMACPADTVDGLIEDIRGAGRGVAVIGTVTPGDAGSVRVD